MTTTSSHYLRQNEILTFLFLTDIRQWSETIDIIQLGVDKFPTMFLAGKIIRVSFLPWSEIHT